MIDKGPAPEGGWDGIRARYEAGVEKVDVIAKDVGLTGLGLSLKAKAEGWTLRTGKKVKALKAQAVKFGVTSRLKKRALPKPEKTSDTIKRLKELLQERIQKLEKELALIGEDIDALSHERQARTVSTVVRTLDKVLELERKDRQRKQRAAKDFRHFDDAERMALARKIERLEAERDSEITALETDGEGGPRAELPVALLGETRTAAADNA